MGHGSDATAPAPLNTLVFYVLLVLAEGDCHGYSISKRVEAETGGAVALRPGRLYPMLKQLLEDAWIVEVPGDASDDPRRRYYRLTARGRRVAQLEAKRLEGLVRAARSCKLLPAR